MTTTQTNRSGPLAGVRIVEFAGLGPAPFCGMLLSDLGADVVRIDRKGELADSRQSPLSRGRRSLALDLKVPEAVESCLRLLAGADGLIEGFRPGVMERLGLGPEAALARNPRLVYGRMTGWGQTGPYAQAAGHDINYIAITGALHAIGTPGAPVPPLNLVGDFGGGALYLAFGMLAGILHARQTGSGQIVDCAMTDGVASLMAMFYGFQAQGRWTDARQQNLLDGGAPFYAVYQCGDGHWISVGAIEPQFYALLLEKLELQELASCKQNDASTWPMVRERFAARIRQKTRAEWTALFDGHDACFGPVLSLGEAPLDPHNVHRQTFLPDGKGVQPAPAPRFSATPGQIQRPPPRIGADNREVLSDWGFADADIEALAAAGAL